MAVHKNGNLVLTEVFVLLKTDLAVSNVIRIFVVPQSKPNNPQDIRCMSNVAYIKRLR